MADRAPPLPDNHALLSLPSEPGADASVLDRLWIFIENRKDADPKVSHVARLLARGTTSVAQKFGEEAVECIVELAVGREGLVAESRRRSLPPAHSLVKAGVRPEEVWAELHRRERASLVGEDAAAAGRKRPAIRRVLGRARAELRMTKIGTMLVVANNRHVRCSARPSTPRCDTNCRVADV